MNIETQFILRCVAFICSQTKLVYGFGLIVNVQISETLTFVISYTLYLQGVKTSTQIFRDGKCPKVFY